MGGRERGVPGGGGRSGGAQAHPLSTLPHTALHGGGGGQGVPRPILCPHFLTSHCVRASRSCPPSHTTHTFCVYFLSLSLTTLVRSSGFRSSQYLGRCGHVCICVNWCGHVRGGNVRIHQFVHIHPKSWSLVNSIHTSPYTPSKSAHTYRHSHLFSSPPGMSGGKLSDCICPPTHTYNRSHLFGSPGMSGGKLSDCSCPLI